MAGGTWDTKNKVRPGVYIRFTSNQANTLTVGDRGVVAICEPLSWGPVAQVMEVEAGADTTPFTGYPASDPHNRFLTEIFKGSNRTPAPKKVLLFRPTADSAVKATVAIGTLTATAVYPGARGNDISVVVTELTEPSGSFQVSTVVDGTVVDQQVGKNVADLKPNAWVTWSGSGALTADTGKSLATGADGNVQAAAYTAFLTAIEPLQFDVLIYDGSDSTTLTAMQSFIKRINREEGKYAQLVAAGMTDPDSYSVINVASGVLLDDGTALTPQQTTWWAGGATAGARFFDSLTYAKYPGAVEVSPKITNSAIIKALEAGSFVLQSDDGAVKVEQDINTQVTVTPDISRAYRKNRVIRTLFTIARDVYAQWSNGFIGVVDNNADGRLLFKGSIVGYLLGPFWTSCMGICWRSRPTTASRTSAPTM